MLSDGHGPYGFGLNGSTGIPSMNKTAVNYIISTTQRVASIKTANKDSKSKKAKTKLHAIIWNSVASFL